MPIDRDPATLFDISIARQRLEEFITEKSKADLDSDSLLESAVLHQLLVLGEAVRRLSNAFRAAHPEIDWSGFIGCGMSSFISAT